MPVAKKSASKKTASKMSKAGMDTRSCRVAVIGAGPAGYVAAIRCAQLGMKTICIDEWTTHTGDSSLGGTCLNVGCIPSKALLETSHLYQRVKDESPDHGIRTNEVNIDLDVMQARKNQVVADLTKGIGQLFEANGVERMYGHAKIIEHNKIEVSKRKTHEVTGEVTADYIIIAAGSSPVRLENAKIKDNYILDSAAALEMNEVPARLAIIGAGAIGLELGSVWSRLGSKVTLLEAMPEFLPMADRKLAAMAKRSLVKQKLDIRLDTRLIKARVKEHEGKKQVRVKYEDRNGESTEYFDKLITAAGRKPNSDRLFGDEIGIETDEGCFIHINKYCQTSVPHIYAIGDVVRGPMLAHKGSEEGMMVAEHIAGNYMEVNYELIPSVIYTHPEVAWAGKTEAECKNEGIAVKLGNFPIAASGRARAMNESEGMIKIIADAETDAVIGVHIFAAQASELIAQAVLMMEMQATAEDIALTMFAHPTLSESLHEAALSVNKRAIHIKN